MNYVNEERRHEGSVQAQKNSTQGRQRCGFGVAGDRSQIDAGVQK